LKNWNEDVAATAVPALAEVGVYAGPRGVGVDVGTPGHYRGGRGYYNYAPGWRYPAPCGLPDLQGMCLFASNTFHHLIIFRVLWSFFSHEALEAMASVPAAEEKSSHHTELLSRRIATPALAKVRRA
jgi:hypothetical protein